MQISIDQAVQETIDCAEYSPSLECRSMQSSEFYEAAIAVDETIVSNYWYLGLSYLLAGREEDAQATWFLPLADADEPEVASYTDELVTILEQEAIAQAETSDLETAWLIRQHLWFVKPDLVNNILELIVISDQIDRLTVDLLIDCQIHELINGELTIELDDGLLERTIFALSRRLRSDLSLEVIKSCLSLSPSLQPIIIPELIALSFQAYHQESSGLFPIRLAELCQFFLPDELGIHQVLVTLYSGANFHHQAIETAEDYDRQVTSKFDKLFASYLIQRSYLIAGDWADYQSRLDRQRNLQQLFIAEQTEHPAKINCGNLIITSFFTPYIEDNPQINRLLQNQLAIIHQNNINSLATTAEFTKLPLLAKTGIIRIGYIASTLRKHSVGWLSRWLFHYHDRSSFQIVNYCINQNPDDQFNHQWFRDKVDISYYLNGSAEEIAAQIKVDEIDILIDLDSLTSDRICTVMAHKSAPVQVTWLGLDASGLPAIDYFIADPYVLPNDAQDYYQEKIWRLPQTYLAVDGFEVGIPTLNRQDLDIPNDAVVYFSSQGGYKRHPDNIRCQMQIIKAVPNSYLLIKGKSDPIIIRDFFGKIAEEEGISLDQLRFLDSVPDEATHRANLAIADIVLDTFPYNGATTTLETLWMGIPLVTQVGQQFAARNSYTFMLNAGIEEGIAWSNQEYVEWGIKLGLDRELRDRVRGKLQSGRTTAPVWNAKQFTHDLEQAYRQMWAIYQQQQQQSLN